MRAWLGSRGAAAGPPLGRSPGSPSGEPGQRHRPSRRHKPVLTGGGLGWPPPRPSGYRAAVRRQLLPGPRFAAITGSATARRLPLREARKGLTENEPSHVAAESLSVKPSHVAAESLSIEPAWHLRPPGPPPAPQAPPSSGRRALPTTPLADQGHVGQARGGGGDLWG